MAERMQSGLAAGPLIEDDAVPRRAPAEPLLRVDELTTWFNLRAGRVRAIDGISFSVTRGECLAIVGESGSGKSVTALSLLRLVPTPPAEIEARAVRFEATDLMGLSEEEMRKVRGRDISMIFQEPMTSLHPILRIGKQITETLVLHTNLSTTEIKARALELMRLVRIPDAEERLRQYPHELSGGMRQRVMIAIALACNPKLLIADEPTTALDVTIQAQILDLIRNLRQQLGMAILLITHDMGVVAENADRVLVMYAGRVVEEAGVEDLFANPLHPYTNGLMASIPRIPVGRRGPGKRERLNEIPGIVPSLQERPEGCAFAPRCGLATDRCRRQPPPLTEKRPDHLAACWEWEQLVKEAS
ncbi:ABC transporter ATP-binding protein [Chelatococcus sp. GCM10030263]|uniref:ABC transporter ATP-binding protein n=1 Tax=Chelatococcus sp. GCM10030263 TaxID=3273387 RepID=UPI00360EC23F